MRVLTCHTLYSPARSCQLYWESDALPRRSAHRWSQVSRCCCRLRRYLVPLPRRVCHWLLEEGPWGPCHV